MLDCLSGGRLVAGLPVGLSYDANLNNGIPTVETRERYEEAVELMFRSWTAEEPFTWNGRFSQYSLVNSWPRPLQKPHPPVWVPGSGSPGTMQWTIDEDFAFVYLGWFGPTLTARRIFDRYWETADKSGVPRNPYRLAFVQNVVVAETDERAEVEYGRYVANAFRQGVGSVPRTTWGSWLRRPARRRDVAPRPGRSRTGSRVQARHLRSARRGQVA